MYSMDTSSWMRKRWLCLPALELHGVPPNTGSLGCQKAAPWHALLSFGACAPHTNSTLSTSSDGKITLSLPCIIKEQKEPGTKKPGHEEVINMFWDDSFKEPESAQQSWRQTAPDGKSCRGDVLETSSVWKERTEHRPRRDQRKSPRDVRWDVPFETAGRE